MLLPPLSLYIHLPWCVRKCPYCDFNSHALRGQLPEENYINALLADSKEDLKFVSNRKLSSIFFGGGTPSLFSGNAIKHLLSEIKTLIPCDEDCEITLEANPGTVERQHFNEYYEAGVNRLSLGVQSFQNTQLKKLGRIHQREEALKAVDILKAAGFKNFNIDLMFGLPNQTVEESLTDLNTALACEPTHISWYQLTLEPNTLFHINPPELPDEETIWAIQEAGQALLAKHNYLQYEISAYAKAGKMCQHNLNYWKYGDYLGIGAGAHGKITTAENIVRLNKVKHPKDYLNPDKAFIAEQSLVKVEDRSFEFMLNALRLNQGLSFELFEQRTGLAIETLADTLALAQREGFITVDQGILYKTKLGQEFLNDLQALFLKSNS